jgi:hypothetical protein
MRFSTLPNQLQVAIVNEVFVKKYFSGQNPLGRQIGHWHGGV